MKLKEKIREFEYEYSFDQKELARILIIASTTLLFFALQGLMTLNSSAEQVEQLQDEYSSISGMVGTKQFNNTISALEDVRSGEIGQRMQYAASVFRGLQDVGNSLESVENDLSYMISMYRWLVLISILGEVAGVSLIYM